MPANKKAVRQIKEFIRKTIQECIAELDAEMRQKGKCAECGEDKCTCETTDGGENGGMDQAAAISHPYSDTEGYYEKTYDTGDNKLEEASKKVDYNYDLPPAVNKPKKPTDPKAPAKQKNFTEPDSKKQKEFTDPKNPKKQKDFTDPKTKKDTTAVKPPPVDGSKNIVPHEVGSEVKEAYEEKLVCPHCGKPYTEKKKEKKNA